MNNLPEAVYNEVLFKKQGRECDKVQRRHGRTGRQGMDCQMQKAVAVMCYSFFEAFILNRSVFNSILNPKPWGDML